MPKSVAEPAYHSLATVAERLGVHVDTVRRHIRNKDLRPTDLGTGRVPRWYISEEELQRFINRRTGL